MSIKLFKEIDENHENIGGKGKSLVKMYKSGFNVPNGFIVSSSTFEEFLCENNIKEQILNLINSCSLENEKNIDLYSNKIIELIETSRISDKVKNEILNKFEELNLKDVAVRSSATSEDGKTSAWAGQLESYLNIQKQDIEKYIKKCWASLFSKRAIFYRLKKQEKTDILVSVIVQQMIQSEESGIAFSINPIDNNNEKIVIEAVKGLGETIVSGMVNPDTYQIDKKTMEIVDKKIGNQTKKIVCEENKNVTKNVIDGNIQKLSNEKIIKIAEEIKNIEKFYGFPIDVEWSIENNYIYILQCRPITTINKNNLDDYMNEILEKDKWILYVKRPFHWLLESSQIDGASEEYQNKYLGFNIAIKNYLILNGDEYYTETENKMYKEKWNSLYENNKNFFEEYKNTLINIVKDIRNLTIDLKKTDFSRISDEEIYNYFINFKNNYIKSITPTYARPDDYLEEKFLELLKELNISNEERDEIFNNIASCSNEYGTLFYSEEPLDLLKISLKKQKGEDVEEELSKHIDKYSWIKAPVKSEMTSFTKEEYVERINELLKFKNLENKISAILLARKNNDMKYKMTIDKYDFKGELLYFSKIIRDFIFFRTCMTEHTDYLFYNARITLLEEIARRIGISNKELVMLSLEEIEDIIKNYYEMSEEYLKKIDDREIGYAIIWENGKVKLFYSKDAIYLQDIASSRIVDIENIDEKDIIKGNVANKGKVQGKVRILNSYSDIKKVKKGDIIVATMTTPDYISAMEKAAGFITDEGGITCHAAIISREFDVPCIVGTVNATKRLKDGQEIEMNAYNGTIKVIE